MKKRLFLSFILLMILGLMVSCGEKNTPADEPKTAEAIQFQSGALENCVIVYGKNNPEFAQLATRLADHILEKYDKFLTVSCDEDLPAGEYEILLGDTNRYDKKGRIMEYSVAVDGGKLCIQAGGGFSADKAVTYLCQQLFTGQEFVLENGEYHHTSFLTKQQELSDHTTARLMSANLLADAFAEDTWQPANYRAEIFAGMLLSYTPDVLGLQETDESWNAVLDTYLAKIKELYGIEYARHLSTYQDKVNYTSLLYRADKFQVADSGMHVFNWWTDKTFHHNFHMRNVSWAQFSSVSDPGKTFLVANTHWSYRTEHAGGNIYLYGSDTPIAVDQLRVQCKDETNTFLSSLRQTYPDIPILLTGDFNTSLPFFTESGWTPASFRVISEEARSNGKSIAIVPTSGHFDHLFGTGNYTIALYGFFKDGNEHEALSDHPFVYVDLSF